MLHCGDNNKSANRWAKKFSNSNKFVRGLTKLLTMVQKYLGIDINVNYIVGKLNGFADVISRGRSSKILYTIFKKEYPTNEDTLLFTGRFLSDKNRFTSLSPKSVTKIVQIKRFIGKRCMVISRAKQKQLGTNYLQTIHSIQFYCEIVEVDP